ncbi:MAG: ATP-binding protein [Gammaproteobacteria bacterium]
MHGQPGPGARLPHDGALFERAPCGLLACDVDGAILRANTTFCNWIGYSEAELTGGKRLQDLLSIGGKLFYQTHCGPLLSIQGSVAEVQLEMVTRTRARIPVLINIVRHGEGDVRYDECAVLITNDRRQYERELLRERKNAEAALDALRGTQAQLRLVNEQLSEAHRRKDEFLATLAHELRNPLAPMRNVLEVVRLRQHGRHEGDGEHGEHGDHGDHGEQGWAFEVLARQMKQLTHLVDDLMDASRITQGRLQLRRARCDLVPIVQAALDDIAAMVEKARHEVEVTLPGHALFVDADETRLAQVVINLLTNAVKYTPEGGRIRLTLGHQDGEAQIAIRDNGIGIPAEALGSVFEMFSQLTPALERSQGGLGIGLALVRGLVELHGGRIAVHSDGAGRGSTFTVTLPLLEQAAEPAVHEVAQSAARGRRILVVDDNVDAADTLAMALELLGNRVRTAHSAEAGLSAAAEQPPDMILLDIGLPDMNGYEVARRIRMQPWGRDVLLVAATGWGQETDRARARDAGFDHHLVKPIEFERLRELIGAL